MAVNRQWPAASRDIPDSQLLTAARLCWEAREKLGGEDALAVRWALDFRDRMLDEGKRLSPLVRYERLAARRRGVQLKLDLQRAAEDVPTRKPVTPAASPHTAVAGSAQVKRSA